MSEESSGFDNELMNDVWQRKKDRAGADDDSLPPGTDEVELSVKGIVALKGVCKAKDFRKRG